MNIKKIIIIFFIVIVLLILSGVFIFMAIRNSSPSQLGPTSTPTPRRGVTLFPPNSQPTTFISPIDESPPIVNSTPGTGANDEHVSIDEQIAADQSTELRNLLPIENQAFSLDYDYKDYMFIVTLKGETTQSQQLFYAWIQENNYFAIPQSKFIFK